MDYDKIILGNNCSFSTDCEKTGLNNNIVVCGASGTGKTMSVIEPCLLETYNQSLIVTVTKRRIVEKYINVMKERGYRVMDLNLESPEKSNVSYDPISYVKNEEDLKFLADAVVGKNPENSSADPYWNLASYHLMISLLGVAMAEGRRLNQSALLQFDAIYQQVDKIMMRNLSNDRSCPLRDEGLESMVRKAAQYLKMDCILDSWYTVAVLPARTVSCVLGTLSVKVHMAFPEALVKMTKGKSIRFSGFGKEKTVLFITSSAVNPSLHSVVNLFYAQMFKELFEFAETCPNARLPIPIRVLCDDFATGGTVEKFPEYISIFREKGISTTILLQSESQLYNLYGANDALTIINNCDSYVYLGGNDIRTAEQVARRADRYVNDVMDMPVGKIIVFQRGHRPVFTKRYDIKSDVRYLEMQEKKTEQSVIAGQAI